MSKIYIAYGSNLNVEQMKNRCPDAQLLATGYLKDYLLLYRSNSRHMGVATVRKHKGTNVPVAFWEISESDEEALDSYEGYPWLYEKRNVYAYLKGGTKRIRAMVYIMNSHRMFVPAYPSDTYVATIRQGYMDCKLDMDVFEDSLELNRLEMFRR